MEVRAVPVKGMTVISVSEAGSLRLERRKRGDDAWIPWTTEGFDGYAWPIPVTTCDILDHGGLEQGCLYQYRAREFSAKEEDEGWSYSGWVRCGECGAIGYTFGNYEVPEGTWGTVVTPDDLRYTYMWGTDFKATNGASFSDEQIRFFIGAATEEIGRRLNITIPKRRIRCDARNRGLARGDDYDVDEAPYDFRASKISRYGIIRTRQRPVLRLHSLSLLGLSRDSARDLTESTVVDGQKGVLKLMSRPYRADDRWSSIAQAVGAYGTETLRSRVFYAIDYDAGYETSDDLPEDLRQTVAKYASVQLLNIIGDGLMSGFSSSSLSMDGLSESFSSTQSATSAYFGARIKEYKDDIDIYIKENRLKFGSIVMGSI